MPPTATTTEVEELDVAEDNAETRAGGRAPPGDEGSEGSDDDVNDDDAKVGASGADGTRAGDSTSDGGTRAPASNVTTDRTAGGRANWPGAGRTRTESAPGATQEDRQARKGNGWERADARGSTTDPHPRAAAVTTSRSTAPAAREVLEPDTAADDTATRPASDAPTQGVRAIAFIVQRPEPYVAPGRSALNHWRLVTLVALLGMLAGGALGFLKPPTYTAESRLVVGKTAQLSNLASVPGLDAAGQSLASSYSRLVSTDAVLSGAAKRLGGSIDGSLSASPIPLSPVIRVFATASSAQQAVAIANAGSRALVDAVNTLNQQQSTSADALLTQYEDADRDLLVAQDNLKDLEAQLQLAGPGGLAADNIQKEINVAQTQVDGLQVKLNALSSAYSGVYNPTAINTQVVQRVGNAEATGSNRRRTIELGVLVGLVGGVLIGLGLAVWLDLHARKRA
jgi:hypothetical protein